MDENCGESLVDSALDHSLDRAAAPALRSRRGSLAQHCILLDLLLPRMHRHLSALLHFSCPVTLSRSCPVNSHCKSAFWLAAVASKAICVLQPSRPDDTRLPLTSFTPILNMRLTHRSLLNFVFANGRVPRHRLEAENEPSDCHPRVCFPFVEPLPRRRLYFASYAPICFATHDTVRCILNPMTNNPSFSRSQAYSTHSFYTTVSGLARFRKPLAFLILSIVSLPSDSQLPTLLFRSTREDCSLQ
jgi:hypothetical protein